jgi:hypothetical protein
VRFSTPVQTGPGAHPVSYTMSTGSFLWVKRPGHGIDHPPPSSTKIKENVELYIYSPSCALMAGYRANFTLPFYLTRYQGFLLHINNYSFLSHFQDVIFMNLHAYYIQQYLYFQIYEAKHSKLFIFLLVVLLLCVVIHI